MKQRTNCALLIKDLTYKYPTFTLFKHTLKAVFKSNYYTCKVGERRGTPEEESSHKDSQSIYFTVLNNNSFRT
jgi:hypothetical protein